jgi:multidrug efflux pump subunit AcrA (membrane-fusion protein)
MKRNKGYRSSALIFLTVTLTLTVSLPGCIQGRGGTEQQGDSKESVLEFEVFKVTKREMARGIEGLGNLVFYDKATVLARIDGTVEEVSVKKGEHVNREDLIMVLSNYQLDLEKIKIEKEVLSAEEELEAARMQYIEEEKSTYKKFFQLEKLDLEIRNMKEEINFLKDHLDRKKMLYEKGGITEEELRNLQFSYEGKMRELGIMEKEYELQFYGFRDIDLIEEGYTVPEDEEEKRSLLIFLNTKMSRKRIEFAQIRLNKVLVELERINWLFENTRIKAPVSGVITDVLKYVGEKVSADEAVTTIINQDKLIARVSFSESNRSAIRDGERVSVYVDSAQMEVEGVIYSVDPYIDVETRSFYVDCLIENPEQLVPGMFVKVKIPVKTVERYLLIPRRAFVKDTDASGYVYIVSKNNRLFKNKVTYADYDDEYVIIREGLKEGDLIIRNPVMDLADGMKITHRGL